MPLQATSGAASYDAFGGGVPVVPVFIEDVFSTYLFTGNGSTQTITNGIDLSTKGGLVWAKSRAAGNHFLYDTSRGVNKYLMSNATDSQTTQADSLTAFNTTGFSIGNALFNDNAVNYASWTFRKQPKFFDCGTFTAGGSTNRRISHALGSAPAFIIIKNTSQVGAWYCYHRSLGRSSYLELQSTNAQDTGISNIWGTSDPTSTDFGVKETAFFASGDTVVYYVFAHDAGGFGLTGTDNVISCGSYTTDGAGKATVNLGYEPQWVMIKNTTSADNWYIADTMRGWSMTQGNALFPNTSGAETDAFGNGLNPTATGFQDLGVLAVNSTFIYIAIRRGPMKVPTSGTSVYNGITRTATNSVANINGVGFPPDICISSARSAVNGSTWFDKLRGPLQAIRSPATTAEATHTNTLTSFNMDGISVGAGEAFFDINRPLDSPYVLNFMRRAPSFFDEVCYLGNNVSGRTITHNLAAAPELMIVKSRTSSTRDWMVYDATNGATKAMNLNNDSVTSSSSVWASTAPTSTVFTVSDSSSVNDPAQNYVAYLFATCAGVSKVGSYTGNGSSQTINCGFTGGARFVLIKKTSGTGDWMVSDSARGIVSGSDPYLELNNTNAEVTGEDWLDTDSTGFVVNEVSGSNANTNGATYIFLAIA